MSFIEAFRLVAWQACVYAERRFELGPKYYCPTCLLPQKDLPNRCPECPLTKLYEDCYRGGCKFEIKARGGDASDTVLDELMKTHSVVTRVLDDNNGKIQNNWPLPFVVLARIILEERAQQKYIHEWQRWREYEDAKRKRR